jgi:hypothetical protein
MPCAFCTCRQLITHNPLGAPGPRTPPPPPPQAAERGHLSACALLLERGAPVNAQRRGGQTPLFAACANGFGSVAAALLVKWQADPTLARDADGATCLHVVGCPPGGGFRPSSRAAVSTAPPTLPSCNLREQTRPLRHLKKKKTPLCNFFWGVSTVILSDFAPHLWVPRCMRTLGAR